MKAEVEYVEVFTPFFRHHKTGKIVFPKNVEYFRFLVPKEKHESYLKNKQKKEAKNK